MLSDRIALMFAMPQVSPSRAMDKFMLRLPSGMRERVANVAAANNRSMNAEIVSRLEASLDDGAQDGDFFTPVLVEAVTNQQGMLAEILSKIEGLSHRLLRIEQAGRAEGDHAQA